MMNPNHFRCHRLNLGSQESQVLTLLVSWPRDVEGLIHGDLLFGIHLVSLEFAQDKWRPSTLGRGWVFRCLLGQRRPPDAVPAG